MVFNKTVAQMEINVRARVFMLGCWLEGSLHPARSFFSVVFLGPIANADLVTKFHVAPHASQAAIPTEILKVSRARMTERYRSLSPV
jgi:hypothetical protein